MNHERSLDKRILPHPAAIDIPSIIGRMLHLCGDPIRLPNGDIITAAPDMLRNWREGKQVDKTGPEYDLMTGLIGRRIAFMPYGQDWGRRREVAEAQLGEAMIPKYMEVIETALHDMLHRWQNENLFQINDLYETLAAEILKMASLVLFGFDMDIQDAQRLAQAFQYLNAYHIKSSILFNIPARLNGSRVTFQTLDDGLPLPSKMEPIEEVIRQIHKYCCQVYDSATSPMTQQENFVTALTQAGLSQADILREIEVEIAGAHQAPAALLSSTLATLALPEGRAYVNTFRSDNPHDGIPFLIEVGRLHPPFWFATRTITGELGLNGQTIPPNGKLAFLTHVYHRNPEVFGEDAADFRPDRFAENTRLKARLGTFLFGRRRCPGENLGNMIVLMVTRGVLDRYDVSTPASKLSMMYRDTARPHQFPMKLAPRTGTI